jgi:hypothetical protein
MPHSPVDKIKVVEEIMDELSKLAGIGGYKAISETITFLKLAKTVSHQEAIRKKAHFIGASIAKVLLDADLTLEEIKQIDDKRPANRNVIREVMIAMLQRDRGRAFSVIEQAIRQADYPAQIHGHDDETYDYTIHLTAEEIAAIRKANLLYVDREWVFQTLNMRGLRIILQNTNFGVREAFDFYDTLSKDEKTNIDIIFNTLNSFIENSYINWRSSGIPLQEIYEDINQTFSNRSFEQSKFHSSTEKLNHAKWLKHCFSTSLKNSLITRIIYSELYVQTDRFTNIVVNQPVTIAKTLIEKFPYLVFSKIGINHFSKPEILTILPAFNETTDGAMDLLASQIISDANTDMYNQLTIDNAQEFIDETFRNTNSTQEFAEKYLSGQKISTPDFKTTLFDILQKTLVRYKISSTLENLFREITGYTNDNKLKFLTTVENVITCYLANQTAAMCENFWKTTLNISLISTTQNVTKAVEKFALPALIQSPVTSTVINPHSSPDVTLPYLFVTGAALTVTGLACAFFKCRRKPAKKSPAKLEQMSTRYKM